MSFNKVLKILSILLVLLTLFVITIVIVYNVLIKHNNIHTDDLIIFNETPFKYTPNKTLKSPEDVPSYQDIKEGSNGLWDCGKYNYDPTEAMCFQEEKSHINDILKVNILDYVSYVHYLLPFMIKIRSGQFIYLSSFRASATCRGVSLYGPSKAFGEKFFEIIGKENAAFGVNSGSIRMGYFDGRMTNMMSEDKIKGFKMSVGNRKLGTSENLTKAIDFMIENNYTNGGTIELTGGISYN